jgi:hypothetical protein
MRNLSHINNLAKLRIEKVNAIQEIEMAKLRLEESFTSLPGKALGSALGMVTGAVATGFKTYYAAQTAPPAEEETRTPPTFTDTLKSVGEETAYFALAKLVEKLLNQQR